MSVQPAGAVVNEREQMFASYRARHCAGWHTQDFGASDLIKEATRLAWKW